MYALERKTLLKTGCSPHNCWVRYAVSANRPLLEKVRAGQSKPKNWRVIPVACSTKDAGQNFAQTA